VATGIRAEGFSLGVTGMYPRVCRTRSAEPEDREVNQSIMRRDRNLYFVVSTVCSKGMTLEGKESYSRAGATIAGGGAEDKG
jgi:hypothetical protein